MKVTNLKDVETYIYSSVILPLKSLNVPSLEYPSPIKGENGNVWQLSTRLAPVNREFRRNYQRTQALRRADWQVILYNGSRPYIIATYNPKNHWVKLYERPFRKLMAKLLMAKIQEAFNKNTPFTKVIVEQTPPVEQAIGTQTNNNAWRNIAILEESLTSDGDYPIPEREVRDYNRGEAVPF